MAGDRKKDCQSKTIELEANINIIAEISDPFTVAKFRQLSILYDTDEKNGPTDRIHVCDLHKYFGIAVLLKSGSF